MPGSDSPPPFAIRFRASAQGKPGKPGKPGEAREPREARDTREPQARLYERTLELTALVAALADDLAVARFHLRDRLDRSATHLAVTCGRAAAEAAPAERRRAYREAKPVATECASLLDIVALRVRKAGRDPTLVEEAQALLSDILTALERLASR